MHRFASLFLALAMAAPASAAPTMASPTARFADARLDVERVSFDRSPDGDALVARVHTTSPVRAYSVDQDGDALELVLYRAHLAPAVERERAVRPVREYRVESDEDRVVVRFEVEDGVHVRAYPDRDSDDLLVSFSSTPRPRRQAWGGGRPSRPVATTVENPGVRQTVSDRPTSRRPAPRQPERVQPVAPAPAETGVGPVPGGESLPIATGAERWRLDTIVLDAGHSAHDFGARANGTSDKEIALGVVSRLGPMIERELGVRVVYTRDDDTFVELRDRGRIANRSGGKLFISVHANAAGSTSARGTETFFLAPRGQGNARDVMERENSVIELESDPSLYADFHGEDDILASLAMSAYQEESQHLARLIEGEFVKSGRHSRGVKQDNFIVLWAASMPAVLVEVGFVTNREEAQFLSTSAGLDQTARSIFEAVRQYKTTYERGLRVANAEG
ncbi:N-acetylmuramoyl-L-alanine amidase family protein [Rubrivirga marina]|uniref:N-acetylmuramoyl-L-alanine amidase n=1 Tax=Rubrivirga marina TaxID=1196024 RepID=A0A271IYB9_9BACT|nr:N-acetylmuramoyl-L-alanine amidase [Rubrivirga marina]PAP76213.1 hypothetical protein BSZ37_07030 [Rubrivirga marina]